MAFTVEDGTGLEDANSYASVAFADTYFADRAVTTWTGDADAKQAALIKATDYIDFRWGGRFLGAQQFVDTPQALQFPRTGNDLNGYAMDDTVPVALQKACVEYALRALTNPLAPDPTNDVAVTHMRRKVGPIETENTYSQQSQTGIKPYPAADMLLRTLVRPAGVIRC